MLVEMTIKNLASRALLMVDDAGEIMYSFMSEDRVEKNSKIIGL